MHVHRVYLFENGHEPDQPALVPSAGWTLDLNEFVHLLGCFDVRNLENKDRCGYFNANSLCFLCNVYFNAIGFIELFIIQKAFAYPPSYDF